MDQRIVEFIAGLRAAGVRISIAESADALGAIEVTGITEQRLFRSALRATLIKEPQDISTFDELFPLYFGSGAPPPPNQPGGGMSDQEREALMQALEEMLRTLSPEQLRQLFESMMTGQPIDSQDMRAMVQPSLEGSQLTHPYYQPWMARRAMRDLQFDRLQELLQELLEKLREAGVSEAALRQLAQEALENQQALEAQLSKEVGAGMLRRNAEEQPQRSPIDDLMNRPFEHLSGDEADDLRKAVTRLAAQLRARAALRRRRGEKGTLDAKSTIRANLRYQGVPIDVRFKRRHLKPKLTLICDVSTSMRPVATFMLLMVYALQDQISRTRSFAFIDDLEDISIDFNERRPEQAIRSVLERMRPGHYNTNLGPSLQTFTRDHMGTIDSRTTLIILGDGRNNYNDPNLRDLTTLKQRAHKLIWFNPEPRRIWGTGDSDMLEYAPVCDAVHQVSNLRELVAAVDSLFTYR